jgi:adenosine deaminase
MAMERSDLLRRMPKAELHLHLDGSLRPQTALELARERGLDDGMDLAAVAARLRAPELTASQAELLEAFDLPIALMQDAEAIERITYELVLDVASDGTRYVEIRWGPALHLSGGLSLRDAIGAAVSGAWGGSSATGVVVRLIAVAIRSHEPALNQAVARECVRWIGDGLTGFDLAGPEEAYPDPLLHARAFEIARQGGLGITVHAGEWGGADQVRRALSVAPARIAHGSRAADDPELMALLRSRGITLDLCPTSNVQASIYPSLSDFPLGALLAAQVPVTLSTDDRTVSDLTLVREYERAHTDMGVSMANLWRMNMHALDVCFLHDDEASRARLRAQFEAFAASEPDLSP